MTRRRHAAHWAPALSATLVLALLVFTTVYRHSSVFSPATAARCHSLSADHTDDQALFAGDFGPLAAMGALLTPPRIERLVRPSAAPRVAPERPVALVAIPFRRPPPSGVA